jgi:hypothetical protein
VAASPLFKGISDEDRKALLQVLQPPPVSSQRRGPGLAIDMDYESEVPLAQPAVQGEDEDVGETIYNGNAPPDEQQP